MPYTFLGQIELDAERVEELASLANGRDLAPHPAPERDPTREELQVRRTAQHLLADHLRCPPQTSGQEAQLLPPAPQQTFWPGISLDLTGAILVDFTLGHTSVIEAVFVQATFHGHAGFYEATFHGTARFNEATFHGHAGFAWATFQDTALFNRATFQGTAGFDGSTFQDTAGFAGATFHGYAGFNEGVRDARVMRGLGAASGRGTPAPQRRGRYPGPGTAAPPAGQRPGVGQMGDRLLHQRPQPRLQAVVGPLAVSEPVDGAAVADRGMPVLALGGQAAEPAVQQAGDLDLVQRVVEPRQLDELLLVVAARPATVHQHRYGARLAFQVLVLIPRKALVLLYLIRTRQ